MLYALNINEPGGNPYMKWRRLRTWLFVPLSLAMLGWSLWPQPRAAIYRLYRAQGRAEALESLEGYENRSSNRFDLYYQPADEDQADLVLGTAEGLYDAVMAEVGHTPEGRVPLILYPTRPDLRQAFGWGNDQSALGVYWRGTVRLLSPHVWIDEEDEAERTATFRRLNPLAHELTHYVLDDLTNGNYPHWFTEGLAQRVEYQQTGYLWLEERATLNQQLYTLQDLEERFDTLPNQALAYRQSYLLVSHIAEAYGTAGLADLIARLGQGTPFSRAVAQSFGRDMAAIYQDWLGGLEERYAEAGS